MTLPPLRHNVAATILIPQLQGALCVLRQFQRDRLLCRFCCQPPLLRQVSAALAAPSVAFLAHQAVYDLSLKTSRGNASVNNATGRILYNFTGSACEGYTTEFRQVSQLDAGENKVTVSDLRSTSWEDSDGKTYRFKIGTE